MDQSTITVNELEMPEADPREGENSRSATHMARFMGRLKMYEAEGLAASDIYRRMLVCIQADLMRHCVRLGERALDEFEERPSDDDTVNHVKTFLAGLR